jgi:surface antigen
VRYRRLAFAFTGVCVFLFLIWKVATILDWNPRYRVGQEIDRLNGVVVFYNGGVGHSTGRNLAPDGYNLGIKYQCVEFVKRYYYEHLNHKMPDSYGHAKQFYDAALADGAFNTQRGLLQYTNGSASAPRADDLLVFGPSLFNRYGHVAIVSAVTDSDIEIVQQNSGPFGSSRERSSIVSQDGRWRCENSRVLGWLRKDPNINKMGGQLGSE